MRLRRSSEHVHLLAGRPDLLVQLVLLLLQVEQAAFGRVQVRRLGFGGGQRWRRLIVFWSAAQITAVCNSLIAAPKVGDFVAPAA